VISETRAAAALLETGFDSAVCAKFRLIGMGKINSEDEKSIQDRRLCVL
jgi:hypothetical protein